MSNAATTSLLIGEKTFKLLQSGGSLIPVPGIGAAAQVALTIIDIAQTVRKNKDDFIALGKEACLIMGTIVERVLSQTEGGQPIDQAEFVKLQEDAKQLLEQMELIKHCVEKYGQKRSWVKRTVRFNADKEAIQKCKDGLKQSLDLFSLQSDIELRKQVAALSRPASAEPTLSPPPLHSRTSSVSQNSQFLSPTISYVGGDITHRYSDDSFNVSGSGNNISFSFAQSNNK